MRDINLPLPITKAVLGRMFPAMLNARLSYPLQRKLMDLGSALQWLPDNTVVHRLRLAGRPAEKLTARGKSAEGAVLYLHGGGYAVGSLATHRSLAARLAHETGCAVYLLDYRLAPEHPFPAGLEDATAAFLELVENAGYQADQIAIAGDSAGGGLSLATAQRLIARHGLTPAALGLIAPWTDPNVIPEKDRDLVINRAWSRACAAAYLGAGDGQDTGYAPLRGELTGLPPTYVQVDVSELLHSQCVELVTALRAAGVHVRFTESQGLWHVAQAQAAFVGPAAAAVTELADFLKEGVQPVSMRDLG
ncbi:alpha/beta hydrolase [Nocardia sp. XZ_19_385]|uniref:alpha/beta hydrolase n=1 Tax=Nocardia sp. XZ_19_385 TaxID=2769488 RepID=UPI001E3A6263|nr:alpha/beta hydrolase [Nocardia sp. XZ_19_385]